MKRFIERDKHQWAFYGHSKKICTKYGTIFIAGPSWVESAYSLYKKGFGNAKIKEDKTFIR